MANVISLQPIRKGYVVAAIVWLSVLAFIATIGYLVYGLDGRLRPVSEGLSDLTPLFVIHFGFLGLTALAIRIRSGRPDLARTIIQVWFAILLLVALTAFVSVLGLLIAPAAYFLYLAMSKQESEKSPG